MGHLPRRLGLALVAALLLLMPACTTATPDPVGGGDATSLDDEISTAEMLVVEVDGAPSVMTRFAPPAARARALGQALTSTLGFRAQQAPQVSDRELLGPRPADRQGLRAQLEWVAAAAVLRPNATTSMAAFRAADRRVAPLLPELMGSADGQAAVVLLAAAGRVLSSTPAASQQVGCPLLDQLVPASHAARQYAALVGLGCPAPPWPEASWQELDPVSLEGCTLFVAVDEIVEERGSDWIDACWRDAFAFMLDGRDARALSDVLAGVLTATEHGMPAPGDARRLATAAARAWRFGGGLNPFVNLDAALRVRAHWLATTLAPDGLAGAPNAHATVASDTREEILLLESVGLGRVLTPADRRVVAEASPASRAPLAAVQARREETCRGLSRSWLRDARGGLEQSSSAAARMLLPLVLERHVACFPQDHGTARRAARALAAAESRVARPEPVDDPDRLRGVARAVEEVCALGGDPAVSDLSRLRAQAERLARLLDLEASGYDLATLADLTLLREADDHGCQRMWWSESAAT